MSDAKPYSKAAQLARAWKPPKRKRLTPAALAVMVAPKMGPCRVCKRPSPSHPHHIVFRGDGGDDVQENIAPVCPDDHAALHNRAPAIARLFLASLSDAEYAYMIERGGEDYPERAYGIAYGR